jgi:multidrug efflux pump subunit AcrA (membrane-fusion protein)
MAGGAAAVAAVGIAGGSGVRMRLGIVCSAALLSACGDAVPKGQVLARVDGIEITRREVLAERRAMGLADAADDDAGRARVIDRLVERKLVARAAGDMLIDRDPDFQIEARRQREMLLAESYRQRIAATLPPPDDAMLARWIAARPLSYRQRAYWTVETRCRGRDATEARALSTVDTAYPGALPLAAIGAAGARGHVWTASDGRRCAARATEREPVAENADAMQWRAVADWTAAQADARYRRMVNDMRARATLAVQPVGAGGG